MFSMGVDEDRSPEGYDSVEWEFVEQMLRALNFPTFFIGLLMECITTPTFSISMNGDQFGFFKGARGLRQGDLLSPLLFTICMEYLSRIIERAQGMEGFKFHALCRRTNLAHLCFADDLLLFCHGDDM